MRNKKTKKTFKEVETRISSGFEVKEKARVEFSRLTVFTERGQHYIEN